MREFWVASGHHLTSRDASGRMRVTDALLLAWLARPELAPPPEACAAERALHARLRAAPAAKVPAVEVVALADADARENWGLFLRLRDALLAAGSVEEGYLALVRAGARLPHLFYDQLVQLILRSALDGCDDPVTLRAAEMLFRPQRGHLADGALMLADDEVAAALEAERHSAPLSALFGGGVEALDVIGGDNAWTYWSRSDAHTMVLPFGADPAARQGLATALAAFLRHLLGLRAEVAPVARAEGVDLRWYVGLDPVGTRIGDRLWHGAAPEGEGEALVGLFEARFETGSLRGDIDGHPVYLLLGIGPDNVIRMKPQNLVMGLPRAGDDADAAALDAARPRGTA